MRASRVVLRSSERLDPLGDGSVLLCAVGPGDLPVRDVADEGVSERELALALDRRAALPADEPLALEPVQRRAGRRRVAAERARPEDLADDCRILEQRLLVAVRPSSRAAMMPWSVSGSGSSSAEPRSR